MGRSATARLGAAFVVPLALASTTALMAGCASVPKERAAVTDLDFEGTDAVSADELSGQIATAESPRFLGVFPGLVYDYEVFDRFVLAQDLERIERYYRARGYYEAKARAARVIPEDGNRVRVVVEVEEGPAVRIRGIAIDGLEKLPERVREAGRRAVNRSLSRGDRFDEDVFAETAKLLRRRLTDRGYACAEVERSAEVDLPGRYALLSFSVTPNRPATFGEVRIEGLGDLPEGPVRRTLDIEPGDPYSTRTIDAAQQALLDLGVFRSVTIDPQLPETPGDDPVVPLKVAVEPAELKSLRLGGGFRLDAIRTDVHLLAGWEHRNLFGGLRHFSATFEPGVVLYPTRIPSFDKPTDYLLQERLRLQLRQPAFVEARSNGFVGAEFNVYPLLLSPDIGPDAPVVGYRELKFDVGADRRFGRLFVSPIYNLQRNVPFTYIGQLDPALDSLLISFMQLVTNLDLRDSSVQPRQGVYIGNDLQAAGLGGDARDVRVQPELRGYVPLGPLTLALRGVAGMLFSFNYGDTLERVVEQGPAGADVDRAALVRDTQLGFFRGFFSGGPNSNRGYPFRGVGPHGIIPFFFPGANLDDAIQRCAEENGDRDPLCEQPLGGSTLWELSAEIRYPFTDKLSGTTFCDTSDVSRLQLDFGFSDPHLSCGLGLRYGTPAGPVRFDAGYRIPGLQVSEGEVEGNPPTLFGLPVTLNFAIGEAF